MRKIREILEKIREKLKGPQEPKSIGYVWALYKRERKIKILGITFAVIFFLATITLSCFFIDKSIKHSNLRSTHYDLNEENYRLNNEVDFQKDIIRAYEVKEESQE